MRAAQRELPAAGRRVIALSSSSVDGADAPPDSGDAPRELTRSGAPGAVGAFTLRFPTKQQRSGVSEATVAGAAGDRWSAPEPRTERIALDERPPPSADVGPLPLLPVAIERAGERPSELPAEPSSGPRQRAIRRGAILAVLAAALLAVVAFAVRAPGGGGVHAAPASASTPVAPSAAPSEPALAPSGEALVVTTAAPGPRVSGHLPVGRAPVPSVTATASAAPTATAAVDADTCRGKVHFASTGSWSVSGGPAPASTPALVTWRCGSYALTATSRFEPRIKRTVSVHVGPDHQEEVSFNP